MKGATRLQVVYWWGRHPMGYRLLDRDHVTVGPSKKASFIATDLPGRPKRIKILRPAKDGFRLEVWPGMEGRLRIGGHTTEVAAFLSQPPPKSLFGKPAYRRIDLRHGDAGEIQIDPASGLRLQFSFVDPPETIPRPPFGRREPLLFRAGFGTAVTTLGLLLALMIIGATIQEDPVVITAERYAKVIAPVVETPARKVAEDRARAEAAERERRRREKEAAESKRAKEEEGRLGREDEKNKETVLPKGQKDVIRQKVVHTGLLAALGRAKAPGSGVAKLFQEDSGDFEQALTGLAGAKVVAGRGTGGLGVAGTGLGGGGTGFGRIQGSGNLDVGAGRGRGRKGPGLGTGKEKEVRVGMETGNPDTDGGLTKEQINRVVRAHSGAIKYCYEKELQRQPQLSGKISLYWVIRANGTVDRARVAESTMGSRAVEGCMERQVKNWQFPKSDGQTIVQSYPFLFKGGA